MHPENENTFPTLPHNKPLFQSNLGVAQVGGACWQGVPARHAGTALVVLARRVNKRTSSAQCLYFFNATIQTA